MLDSIVTCNYLKELHPPELEHLFKSSWHYSKYKIVSSALLRASSSSSLSSMLAAPTDATDCNFFKITLL